MSSIPTNEALEVWINPTITEDFLHCIRGSDQQTLLWIDADGDLFAQNIDAAGNLNVENISANIVDATMINTDDIAIAGVLSVQNLDAAGSLSLNGIPVSVSPNWINVLVFGAKGDGLTDDTAAIQAAINACDSTHGVVYFPAGSYKISTTLTNSANLTGLVGDGSAITTVSTNGSWTGNNGITITPVISGTKNYGMFLEGLTITGPGAGSPAIITNYAIASGVATITASNSFTAGQVILIQGLTTTGGAKLNNNFVTVSATGLSSSQFEFSTALGNDAGGTDTGVATLDCNGISVVNSGTNSDGPYNLRMLDVQSNDWQGDGFKIIDSIVSSWKNCIGASNGGNGFGFYSDNLTGGGLSGTSCHFDTCYGNGNYKAGFYAYLLLYSAFTNCASDGNGAAYFMERCEGIGFYSCGFESLVYRNATYPAHGFWIHGTRAVVLDGCRGFIGSGNNVASCSLQVDTTLTQGSQASSNVGARNFRVTGSGSATQPTNDFFLDSNTTACIVDGFSFFSATNFTNSGSNNRIWINGSFRSPVVTTGAVTVGGLLTASAGLDVTGDTVLTGQLRVSGSITASNGTADLINSNGTLTAAQNGDVLIFTGATAGAAAAGAFTSIKVYGFHSNLNSVSITGTPNFTADFHAAGQCTAGTTNYGFYEDGSNPNYLGGSLAVEGLVEALAGLSVTGAITGTSLALGGGTALTSESGSGSIVATALSTIHTGASGNPVTVDGSGNVQTAVLPVYPTPSAGLTSYLSLGGGVAGFIEEFWACGTTTVSGATSAPTCDSLWSSAPINGGTTGTILSTSGTILNPGQIIFTTPATTGDGVSIYKGGGANSAGPLGILGSVANWQLDFWFKLPATITNYAVRVGYCVAGQQVGDAPSGGSWLEYDTANADSNSTFEFRTVNSSTSNYDATPAITPTANDWYHLRIYSTTPGTISYQIGVANGSLGTATNITTDVDTTHACMPFIQVLPRTNTAATLVVDRVSFISNTGRV